jgi:hypothetical protein
MQAFSQYAGEISKREKIGILVEKISIRCHQIWNHL